MEQNPTATAFQRRIGVVVLLMAGAVATTPLALAVAVGNSDSSARNLLLVLATVVWLLAVVTYRGLALAHEHWRRRTLRKEVAAARRARLDASASFQDKLNDHHAILERIAKISGALLDDGIIDPHLAIDNVRLINAHATEAQALLEDAITEIRVETGAATITIETFDIRGEIEEVVAPFVRGGIKVATAGPRHFAEADPAMFRLMVRGLITAAVERKAADIDVAVVRNDDTVVCTVSDDGDDSPRVGPTTVPAVVESLALTLGIGVDYSRALGRNQYSITVPAAETPTFTTHTATPLDVRGQRQLTQSPHPTEAVRYQPDPIGTEGVITFIAEEERDLARTVAARRRSHPASR